VVTLFLTATEFYQNIFRLTGLPFTSYSTFGQVPTNPTSRIAGAGVLEVRCLNYLFGKHDRLLYGVSGGEALRRISTARTQWMHSTHGLSVRSGGFLTLVIYQMWKLKQCQEVFFFPTQYCGSAWGSVVTTCAVLPMKTITVQLLLWFISLCLTGNNPQKNLTLIAHSHWVWSISPSYVWKKSSWDWMI